MTLKYTIIRHIRYVFLLLVIVFCFQSLMAQSITDHPLSGGSQLFNTEVGFVLNSVESQTELPDLNCVVEYLRRGDSGEILYRRGPTDLRQLGSPESGGGSLTGGKAPSAAGQDCSMFQGGILLDVMRAGETMEAPSLDPSEFRYLLRIAIIPQSYFRSTLNAQVVLERAIVSILNDSIQHISNEVFSRAVVLEGNLPLKFELPPWEAHSADGRPFFPETVHEAVLVTLETPRYFTLAPNFPEPFRSKTKISYTTPTACYVRLSVVVHDVEYVIDEGRREAGLYHVSWDSENATDGSYTTILEASDQEGKLLFHNERLITKAASTRDILINRKDADTNIAQTMEQLPKHALFSAGVESGLSYQFPQDAAKRFRNMFTHLVFRTGMYVTRWMELGIVAGQDAFHEYPSDNIDTDRISDFGGVVAWSYGYVGPYLRLLLSSRPVKPFLQMSVVWSDVAIGTEITGGVHFRVLPQVDIYLGPSIFTHIRETVSSKIGIHYGMMMRL